MMEVTSKNIRFLARMGTRGAYGQAITEMAEEGYPFYATTADLARSSGYDRLKANFPEKFFDCGISEQNMVGLAAGIARTGTPVFASTFGPFASLRCADQIKNYMGYMGMNVKMVALDSGLTLASLGSSHYGLEDMTLISSIPNIVLISPADALEIYQAVYAAAKYQGPVYIRITGGTAPQMIHRNEDYRFEIGKAITLKEGSDVAILACGAIIANAIKAVGMLEKKNISCTVVDMHTVRPLDRLTIDRTLSHKLIVTVEEHSIHGGFGSAVAEYLAPISHKPPQLMLGVNGFFPHAGDYQYLLEQCGLTAEQIAQEIETKLLTL